MYRSKGPSVGRFRSRAFKRRTLGTSFSYHNRSRLWFPASTCVFSAYPFVERKTKNRPGILICGPVYEWLRAYIIPIETETNKLNGWRVSHVCGFFHTFVVSCFIHSVVHIHFKFCRCYRYLVFRLFLCSSYNVSACNFFMLFSYCFMRSWW